MKKTTFESYYNILTDLNKQFVDMYMIRINDYLTDEAFADYYEISIRMAKCIILEGRAIRENILSLIK